MIQSNEIFIPIPKAKNNHCKVDIRGNDVTGRIIESMFVYPTTTGIGTFSLKLSNTNGQYSGRFTIGDIVRFYADNLDNTTLQFWGRIDYARDNISKDGQFLEISGRHKSYLLTEFLVCHTATSTSPAEILKDIVDKLPAGYGFTYTNVAADTDSMDVEWNYKPFWDCVFELCNHSGFDCYVDNDLDFHYFEENSIANTEDAIVEGDNFIKTSGWGTDDTYEKTRVTAIGQDGEGLPIIYTAIDSDEGDDIKEVFIKDTSANTETKVQNIAESKLLQLTNRAPQAVITSLGLETVKPGENIWLLIPRQQIHGQYKIIQITHSFGSKSGGWRTECLIEEEEVGVSQMIQTVSQQTTLQIKSDNINKMTFSYNFTFDEDTGTHSSTEITDGVLKTDGGASGTWISENKSLSSNAEFYELRVIGESLPGTNYYFSTDGGNTWQSVVALKTIYTCEPPGPTIKIKVDLNSADTQIKGIALLYK